MVGMRFCSHNAGSGFDAHSSHGRGALQTLELSPWFWCCTHCTGTKLNRCSLSLFLLLLMTTVHCSVIVRSLTQSPVWLIGMDTRTVLPIFTRLHAQQFRQCVVSLKLCAHWPCTCPQNSVDCWNSPCIHPCGSQGWLGQWRVALRWWRLVDFKC